MIAHLIETEILPRVEFAVDLHSGSRTMEYLPCAVIARSEDPQRFQRSLGMLDAFAMPTSMIIDHSTGGDGALIGACRRVGVYHLSTELGGGGTVSRTALNMAETGLFQLLHHIGVLRHPITGVTTRMSRRVARLHASQYVYAANTEPGLFEPFVGLGDEIEPGQSVGMIHFTSAPWRKPEPVVATSGGIVLCRRIPARTALGDFVFALGRDWTDES